MKSVLLAGVAAVAILSSSQVFAQEVTVQVSPEQRTTIREYVVKRKVKPVTIKSKVVVGTALPADIELVAVPGDWGPTFTKYRYVYWDNRVVLVNPDDRRVVHIID
jgi:hypothetical protein